MAQVFVNQMRMASVFPSFDAKGTFGFPNMASILRTDGTGIHIFRRGVNWRKIANDLRSGFGPKPGWAAVGGGLDAAFQSALVAREEILMGDLGAVESFIMDYLTRHVYREDRDAVLGALLQDEWLDGPRDNDRFVPFFKRFVRAQRAAWRHLTETEINHRFVVSLDGDSSVRGAAEVLEMRAPAEARSPEFHLLNPETSPLCPDHSRRVIEPLLDARIRRQLDKLDRDELRTAYAWASETWEPKVRAWEEAARYCGIGEPAQYGERVRRKLRRLGREEQRRRS
ncbi:hypothetical protein ACFXKK_02445 [Streptomyces globisporus]|uniref:hypothetical protein n=1 Tax=Streptomyces globisporus TaxID=1908 RepID=UPI00364EB3E0